MNDNKTSNLIRESNKISGISYAFTDNGYELPILDITHPLFTSSISEEQLAVLQKQSAQKALEFKATPEVVKKAIAEKSLIFGKIFNNPHAKYLSGLSTYVYKLGPNLLGGGEERNLDKMISTGIGGIAIRMRLHDLCKLQAEALLPYLKADSKKGLVFINLAGGTACDSINTLILISKENPSLLANRKIEINIFDIDNTAAKFAIKCIEKLKEPENNFSSLEITINYTNYDWSNTDKLVDILSKNIDRIVTFTSEGGLFEYGSDDAIMNNLSVLYENSPDDLVIGGSILRDKETIDPTMSALAEESEAALRLLGIKNFTSVIEKTNWKLYKVLETNPIYIVFTLTK